MNLMNKSGSSSLESLEGWEDWPQEARELLLLQLKGQLASTSATNRDSPQFEKYKRYPERFATEVLDHRLTEQQVAIAHAIRDYTRVAVKAGHAVGKCVHEDDEILVAAGNLVRAGDLVGTSFEVKALSADFTPIVTTAYAQDNGIESVVEITTDSGAILRRTVNHPLWTARGRFTAGRKVLIHDPGWRQAGDIKSDDVILAVCDVSPTVTKEMPDDEIKFLAYVIGDGNCGQTFLNFSQAAGPVLEEMKTVVMSLGAELRWIGRYDYGVRDTRSGEQKANGDGRRSYVLDLLRRHGLWRKGSHDKRIPSAIFTLPTGQLALFLSRLYATDGWATVGRQRDAHWGTRCEIGFTSVSDGLCRDIQTLLRRFDIVAKLRRKKTSWTHNGTRNVGYAYSVDILRANDLERFAELIGIFGKEDSVASIVEAAGRRDINHRRTWQTRKAPAGFRWERVGSVSAIGECRTTAIAVPGAETFLSPFVEHNTNVCAAIVLWFLHCFNPAIVVTTAPSLEQVRNEVWREIRRDKSRAKVDLLPGLKPVDPFWDIEAFRFMQGISTDKGERFRGKHCENMLFLFEEANGIPQWAWDEADNMCTAPNNKILAVANPIDPSGPYYQCFKAKSGWHTITQSSLDHPNVIYKKQIYPGAASYEWASRRVKSQCMEIDPTDRQTGDFEWEGKLYRPTPTFQSRVLGEFPDEGPDTLIPLSWVVRARNNRMPLDELAPVDMGMDVAYSGGDYCVIWARRGPCVIARRKWQGLDPDKSCRELGAFIKNFNEKGLRVGNVAIDGTGIGAGVAANLMGMVEQQIVQCDNALSVMVGERALDAQHFANKRAELAFALSERFRLGQVDLTRVKDAADDFETQAVQIQKKREARLLRETIESKEELRKRTNGSPDDFDAMVLCFIDTVDTFAQYYAQVMCTA